MILTGFLRQYLRPTRRIPVLGRSLLLLYRLRLGKNAIIRPAWFFLKWLCSSKEYTNITYDLTELNKVYLSCFVADITGITYLQAREYMSELEDDSELKTYIQQRIKESKDGCFTDADIRFGRRLGWYALARALKPGIIVETGVDKGLGACVLTAALKRNAEEGHHGYYYGTDINPKAGYLLKRQYAEFGRILYGDSIESLDSFEHPIDLFINDSDHSAEYEGREYKVIENKLSQRALVLGDNSHITDELLKFAVRTDRSFLYFQEWPNKHWHTGGGIGAAFCRSA